jgi:hypothetical protein
LVLHIALGRKYREHRVKQGDVCYVACEGERGLNNRVAAWRQHNGVEAAPFWLLTTHLDLAAEHKQLVSDIRDQIGETQPSVLVLDTLNRSLNGSESSDDDMAAYIHAADFVRDAFGCAVIIIHHCGLDTTRPRGHTSLKGASDAQIAVINIGQTVLATVERLKDGVAGTTVASTLGVIDLGRDEDSEPVTSCAIEPTDVPDKTDKKGRLTEQQARALETLTNLIAAAGESLPDTSAYPSDKTIQGVRRNAWRTECARRHLSQSEVPDSQRKTFDRASEKLLSAGRIAAYGDWVWLV